MSLVKIEATVIRRVLFSNSSLIVTFLTPGRGLLETIAKGCRAPKSRLFGTLDYFNSGELVFYEKHGGALHLVDQFSPERERTALKTRLDASCAASFMAEAACAGCAPDDPAPEVSALLLDGLEALETDGLGGLQAALVFGLRLLAAQGFEPSLEACVGCGDAPDAEAARLDPEAGGLVCEACRRGRRTMDVGPGAWSVLRFLAQTGFAGASRLSIRPRHGREALSALRALLQAQFGRSLRSAGFFEHLIDRRAVSLGRAG